MKSTFKILFLSSLLFLSPFVVEAKKNSPLARYVWLTQTEQYLPHLYKYLRSRDDTDVICLAWKTPFNTSDPEEISYYPQSTWTQGRNRLYELALRQERLRGKEYDYMIFADDDIELTSKAKNVTNPIDEWYSFLRETQPAVGIGRFRQVGWERDRLVSVCNFDAVLNAFHRDVVPVLLPYTERSDGVSWWMSQLILERKACAIYNGHILRLPTLRVSNQKHRPYARGSMMDIGLNMLKQGIYSLPPRFHSCFSEHLFTKHNLLAEPPAPDCAVACRPNATPERAATLFAILRFDKSYSPCVIPTFQINEHVENFAPSNAPSQIRDWYNGPSRVRLKGVDVAPGDELSDSPPPTNSDFLPYVCQPFQLGAFQVRPYDGESKALVPGLGKATGKHKERMWEGFEGMKKSKL